MLVNYEISKDDVMALIEVARNVKERNIGYIEEYETLMENGFYSTLIDVFGDLQSAKRYFESNINTFEGEYGGMRLVIDYIDRIIRQKDMGK